MASFHHFEPAKQHHCYYTTSSFALRVRRRSRRWCSFQFLVRRARVALQVCAAVEVVWVGRPFCARPKRYAFLRAAASPFRAACRAVVYSLGRGDTHHKPTCLFDGAPPGTRRVTRTSGSNQTLGTRQAMSQKGGKRAYRSCLGKVRSACQSRHSIAYNYSSKSTEGLALFSLGFTLLHRDRGSSMRPGAEID